MPESPSSQPISLAGLIANPTGANTALQITSALGQQAGLQKQAEAWQAEQNAARDAQAGIVQEGMHNAAVITAAQGELQLKREAEIARVKAAINPTDEIIALARQYKVGSDMIAAEQADIVERMNTGFYDDPLAWIYNQFYLPGAVQAHNAKVAANAATAQKIDTLQRLADTEVKSINSTAATTSAEMVEAQTKAQILAGLNTLESMKEEKAKNNLQFIQQEVQWQQQTITAASQLHSMWVQDQNLALARAQEARAKATFDVDKQLKELQLADLKNADAMIATISQKLQLPTGTLNRTSWSMLPADTRAAATKVFLASATADKVGMYPVDLVEARRALPVPFRNPQAETTYQLLSSEYDKAELEARSKGATTPSAVRAYVNTHINNFIQSQQRLISQDAGIYSAPNLQALEAADIAGKRITDIPLWSQFVSPRAKVPSGAQEKLKAQDLMTIAAKTMQATQDPVGSAAMLADQISSIYSFTVQYNNKYKDYGMLALPLQQGYTVKLAGNPFATFFKESGGVAVDMTNRTAVQNYLLRVTAAESYRQFAASEQAARMANPAMSGVE